MEQSRIVMRGMLFPQNTALVNKGGAALAHDNSEMNVTSTTVADNVATRGGGLMVQFSCVCGSAAFYQSCYLSIDVVRNNN